MPQATQTDRGRQPRPRVHQKLKLRIEGYPEGTTLYEILTKEGRARVADAIARMVLGYVLKQEAERRAAA